MAGRFGGLTRPGLAAVLVAGLLAVTACAMPHATLGKGGGGAGSGQQALSVCMRSHGITDFPDSSGGGTRIQATNGVWKVNGVTLKESAAQIQGAMNTCQAQAGQGAASGPPNPALQRAALADAQCMRAHGVPKYPDPTVTGNGISVHLTKGDGVDPNSPQFKQAQAVCQGAMLSALQAAHASQGAKG